MLRSLLPSLSALLLAGALPAEADEPMESIAVDLAISGAREPPELTTTLTLPIDHGCSSLMEHHGQLTYEINVCREGGTAAAPVLTFNVERNDHTPSAATSRKFKVATRLTAGRRATIARLAYDQDQGREKVMQITATVH